MTELIVALDGEPGAKTRAMMSDLMVAGVRWFKVGVPMLLHPEGRRTADFIRHLACQMMLDLKLYDTRDTALRSVDAACEMGASMLTVHDDCLKHIAGEDRIKILAVRKLTDGTGQRPAHWGRQADGIVCSVRHAQVVRRHTDTLLVCPGIRRTSGAPDNHKDIATASDACAAGADYIVVGRPIYAAADPVKAALAIQADLADIA